VHDVALTPDEARALAERLGTYDSMRALPLAERAWLVAAGTLRHYERGERAVAVGEDVTDMLIVLAGRLVVYFGHGAGRRHSAESLAGSLTGVLPYSRLKRAPYDVVVEETVEGLVIHRDCFPAMIRECPVLTEYLVHTMLDRARRFSAANWEDEKVTSLGRLAAGLSHELNNPAAAAARGARILARTVTDVGEAAQSVGAAPLTEVQRNAIGELVTRCQPARRLIAGDSSAPAHASETNASCTHESLAVITAAMPAAVISGVPFNESFLAKTTMGE
jgi:CRP-like cAMP-binding protein